MAPGAPHIPFPSGSLLCNSRSTDSRTPCISKEEILVFSIPVHLLLLSVFVMTFAFCVFSVWEFLGNIHTCELSSLHIDWLVLDPVLVDGRACTTYIFTHVYGHT